jgi:hypothetical protein
MSAVSGSTEPLLRSCLVSADSRQCARVSQVLLAQAFSSAVLMVQHIENGAPVIDI